MWLLKHNTLGSTILEKPDELSDIVTLRNKRKVGKVLIDSLRYLTFRLKLNGVFVNMRFKATQQDMQFSSVVYPL